MKLPDELTERLPQGKVTFHFTVLNGEVKVHSVTANGKELDLVQCDRDASGEPNS